MATCGVGTSALSFGDGVVVVLLGAGGEFVFCYFWGLPFRSFLWCFVWLFICFLLSPLFVPFTLGGQGGECG